MITEKTVRLLKELYGTNVDGLIDSRYDAFEVYHSSLNKVSGYRDPSYILYMIHRDEFDHAFLREAEKGGCTLLLGDGVVNVRDNAVVTGSGREIAADQIIGADGPHSVVRKFMYREAQKKDVVIGLEAQVAYEDLKCFQNKQTAVPRIYFGFVQQGYGWVFPKKDFAVVGIAGIVQPGVKNIREAFLIFLETVCKDTTNAVSGIRGLPVPVHNRVRQPGRGNVLLAGDAAGLVDPLTGEGIYFGVLSGTLAARAILSHGNPAGTYNTLVQRHIQGLFRQARIAKALFYRPSLHAYAMHKMQKNGKWCKYFLALLSGDMDYKKYFMTILRDRRVYPPI